MSSTRTVLSQIFKYQLYMIRIKSLGTSQTPLVHPQSLNQIKLHYLERKLFHNLCLAPVRNLWSYNMGVRWVNKRIASTLLRRAYAMCFFFIISHAALLFGLNILLYCPWVVGWGVGYKTFMIYTNYIIWFFVYWWLIKFCSFLEFCSFLDCRLGIWYLYLII